MKGLLTKKLFSICLVIALVILTIPPVPGLAANTRYEETHPSITYSGTWSVATSTSHSGGSAKYSAIAGAYAEFKFTGTSISWIGNTRPDRGIAKVYIDGIYQQDVDLYDAAGQFQKALFTKTGLSNTTHAIRIEVTNQKNPSSSGNVVIVDAFETDGAPVPPSSPSNVKVVAPTSGGSLVISWTNPSEPNFSYVEIERSDAAHGETKILPDRFTSSPAEDRDLAGGVEYSYGLRAVDASGNPSAWTSPVSAVPYAMAPGNVTVTNEGSGGKLIITWTNPPAGTFSSIRIYRSTTIGSLGLAVGSATISGSAYTDTGLDNGVTYYYTVRAVDFAGKESLNTDQHSGSPSVSRTRYEEDSASIAYSGTWTNFNNTNYSGGTIKASNAIRSSATFTFTGTSVSWVASMTPTRGIAKLYIDNVYQVNVDLYSASPVFAKKVYIKTGLTNATHTLKVEVTGTKNPASSDTFVDVDAFDLDATPSAGIPAAPSATPVVAGATASPGEIVGRVVNQAGQTIPGTAVRVNATVVPTNPGGEFRFTLVASGIYTVYYDAPGYRGQTQMIEVKAGQSTQCPTVIMDPGATPSVQGEIFGRVVNPAHQPIAGAAVRINSVVIPTNAAGEFRFQLVNPGVYTIYYDAAGYAGQTQVLEVKAGMVTYPPMVILSGTLGEIYGRVLDIGTRRAIPGTAVRVNSSVMPTNPGGEFRFTLVHPGIYKVYYDAPGYKGQIQENITVFAGTTTICFTVLMSR